MSLRDTILLQQQARVAPTVNATPVAPTLIADDETNTLIATHSLDTSQILVSVNNAGYNAYGGTISVGDVARAAGYYKFKIKAAQGRNESSVVSSPAFTMAEVPNSFTLTSPKKVSVGIYQNDGTDDILVRTLTSGEDKPAGTHLIDWNGKDEEAVTLSSIGTYKAKSVSNTLTATWALIGNTSTATGTKHWQGFENINDIAIAGNNAYIAKGYDENPSTMQKFLLSNQQEKYYVASGGDDQKKAVRTTLVATDGTLVYWVRQPGYEQGKWYVVATNVSNDAVHTFPNGVEITPSEDYAWSSAISYTDAFTFQDFNYTSGNSVTFTLTDPLPLSFWKAEGYVGNVKQYDINVNYISVVGKSVTINFTDLPKPSGLVIRLHYWQNLTVTGIAANDNFIFVARENLNQVSVLNKNGSVAQTVTITSPRKMCVDGNSLWVITGNNTVAKYTVNVDGTLTAGLTLSGLTNPLSMSVSGTNVFVVDAGTHQVKLFNKNTGAAGTILGQAGGYANNENVFNDKFMIVSGQSFIAFQSDGSYWLGDAGNQRVQHFSSTHTYINNIMYMRSMRSAWTDRNNPNRVFGSLLEFSRDYTKALLPSNGSWTLVKNWSTNVPPEYGNEFYYLADVSTLSNGRTYGFLSGPNGLELAELVPNSGIRLTGISLGGDGYQMRGDGDIVLNLSEGSDDVYLKRTRTGWDENNNPILSAPVEVERIAVTTGDPRFNYIRTGQEISSTGVRWMYNDDKNNVGSHVGGIKNGKIIFKSAPSTHGLYNGPFPSDGAFDIGNSVGGNKAGGPAIAIDRLLIQGYIGEFWKQAQTNMFNLYYDNGLYLTQFGMPGRGVGLPMSAGNAITVTVNKVGNDYYIHHGDESMNGGVHEFKISGSVTEQIIPIAFPVNYIEPVINYLELTKDLPAVGYLTNGNGWTLSNPISLNDWFAKTGDFSYKAPTDILASYDAEGTERYIQRDLGANTGLTAWSIVGQIRLFGFSVSVWNIKRSLQVLDSANRIIAEFDAGVNDFGQSGSITGNGTAIHTLPNGYDLVSELYNLANFSIIANSEGVTFSYKDYTPISTSKLNPSADWANPKTLRFYFNGGGRTFGRLEIGLKGKFYKTT